MHHIVGQCRKWSINGPLSGPFRVARKGTLVEVRTSPEGRATVPTATAHRVVMEIERPLTTKQLAEFLQVPVRTLEDWRGRDYGPRWWYAGNRVRYSPAAVREWMTEQQNAA